MGIEIERKFFDNHEKWHQLEKPEGTPYRQGYILNDESRSVRIRITDTHSYLTLKGSGASNRSRKEYEYEIPISDGMELLETFTTKGTRKNTLPITI